MTTKELESQACKKILKDENEPERYHVIIYNDEVTTQEFVVMLLASLFGFTLEGAVELMLEIHISGKGIAGTYAYDIALFKQQQATAMAKKAQYPLKIECEKVK